MNSTFYFVKYGMDDEEKRESKLKFVSKKPLDYLEV